MDSTKYQKRILFLGVPDMAFVCLDTLLYAGFNIVGVIGPKKTHNTYATFRNFVKTKGLPFLEYDLLNDEALLETVKNLKPDIAVVASFNDKIPKEFIDLIPNGILNIHPSLLPLYRGGNPYSRVIMNGETETGVTIHYIAEQFDVGDIVLQQHLKLDSDETMGTLFNKTNELGVRMLVEALIKFEKDGHLDSRKQPQGEYPLAPNIKDHEMIIDFNKTAVEIDRLIRALNPYFSAMILFKNQMVRLHKVSVEQISGVNNFENGQICAIKDNKVYIKTADGCIIPEVMQYAGYFIGDCSDFIRIINPSIGDKFTNGYT